MFGVLGSSATTSFARSAEAVKVRAATEPVQLAERTAVPNGRPTASRRAIAIGEGVVEVQVVGRRAVMSSSPVVVARCEPQARVPPAQPAKTAKAGLPRT